MTKALRQPDGLDVTRPSPARIYDYMLRGSHHFEADADAAERILAVVPEIKDCAWSNRGFHQRAAAWIAKQGVTQFLDIGSGLPTVGNTHEVVSKIHPDARVVYVDNDPVAVNHMSVLLGNDPGVVVAGADLTSPAEVLSDPAVTSVIDLTQPACVIFASVLHFIDPETAGRLVSGYAERMPPGSWIAISVGSTDDEKLIERARGSYTISAWNHGPRELTAWLDGLDLVPPGITEARRWISGIDDGQNDTGSSWYVLCAAAVKR
jgi:S-adenosyl methyltransferase